jgi:peptide/nickel transport system substrate-binding protein
MRPTGRAGHRRLSGAVTLATLLALGGCSAVSFEKASSGSPGELTVVNLGPVATWDPQRITSRQDMAFAGRVFARTLTTYPPGDSSDDQTTITADLATGTGTADKSLKTWSFTLRDDAKWQDGTPVTCEDVKYGVSRSFAEPFATEGPNYALVTLDVPREKDGTSTYAGPYSGKGRDGFDKAVSCKGPTITFRLTEPTADFNELVSLPAFAPYKQGEDTGEKSVYTVFSNGPYMLKGAWDASAGGTFVRNPHWSAASDPIRKGRPESIRYQEGVESQTATQHIMADEDTNRSSVGLGSAPPAMQQHIAGDPGLRQRSVNPRAQFLDYLALNVKSPVLRSEKARQALAVSTNRDGYVNALGGSTAAEPAFSLIGEDLPGHVGRDPFGSGAVGDAAAARGLLAEGGLTLPVRLRVSYRSTPTADKAMAALANGWEAGGFDVTLQPLEEDYFEVISAPGRAAQTDVFWASWAPAWPSASTILPPLFDSRINLSKAGTGRDYGHFADDAINKKMTAIATMADREERAGAWAEVDAELARRGAYVALAQRKSLFIAGSEVDGLATNAALGGFVDLAAIGLK